MEPVLNSKPMKWLTRPVRSRLKAAMTRVARNQVSPLRVELKADHNKMLDTATKVEQMKASMTSVQDLGSRVEEMRAVITSLQRESDRRALRVADLGGEVAGVRCASDELAERQREVDESQRALDARLRELTSLYQSYRSTLELILGPTGRYMSRFISDDEVQELVVQLSEFAGDRDRVVVAIHQAYRALLEIEMRCVGRIAGSTPNVIARMAAISLTQPPSGEVLEIGTLFGVGAVSIARQLARIGKDAQLTIVDPFAGFQIQPDRDESLDIASTPVTRAVADSNLALGGVSPDHYRLIEGTSDSADVRRVVEDRAYGLIVIDGDHSEEFAYEDLLWAESMAVPDALVVLDDYDDPAWPGVAVALKRYLDRPESTLRLVGTAATTAFLRAASGNPE